MATKPCTTPNCPRNQSRPKGLCWKCYEQTKGTLEENRQKRRQYYQENKKKILKQQNEYQKQRREEDEDYHHKRKSDARQWRQRFKEAMQEEGEGGQSGLGLSPEGYRYREEHDIDVPEWPELLEPEKSQRHNPNKNEEEE